MAEGSDWNTIEAVVELRDETGRTITSAPGKFIAIGGVVTNPGKITFEPISGLGRKSATIALAHVMYADGWVPVDLHVPSRVWDDVTPAFEPGSLRFSARQWREGFDPNKAATWTREERAAYDVGYRAGQRSQKHD